MEEHYKLSDQEFEEQFISCTMDPLIFSHEAHLRLSWLYLRKYGLNTTESMVQDQLKQYVTSLGAEEKYHTTLTVAAIRVVDHFISRSKSDNFKDFISEFPRLKMNFRELINAHYGFDIYSSEKGKAQYLKPDLLPFDGE
ncbi:hypothetical protein LVD13_11960 [Flavobacteriaceae bacterium D16]|nr:hypothetical protein [Flavobacteriaceae bacterium D16]